MWGLGLTEWFLLIVVVILIPLAIAVVVTLWSLEQARQRNKRNRPGAVRRRVELPVEDGAALASVSAESATEERPTSRSPSGPSGEAV